MGLLSLPFNFIKSNLAMLWIITFSAGFIGAVSTPSLGVHRMQIKHLTLEVSSGDITKERCDAIVNSSNSMFSLKSGKHIVK